MPDAARLRGELADRLVRHGTLREARVERAMRAVPRHVFTKSSPLELAYDDCVIRLKEHGGILISSLSQPSMIAEMLQQLDVRAGDRVLEIGTGSGYTTALLAELTGPDGAVVSIDLESDLIGAAQHCFDELGYGGIHAFAGDGASGAPEHAPFQRILITACVTDIERAWWDQLAPGGRIVLPLSLNGVQKSIAFQEHCGTLASSSTIDCGFVMLRGATQGTTTHRLSEEVFLSAQGQANLDWAAIYALLTNGKPLTGRIPGDFSPADFYSGAALWLALHDHRFFRLEMGANALTIPTLLASSGGHRLSVGLCSGGSIALLGFKTETAMKAPALVVIRYGDEAGLGQRIKLLLAQWDALGRPGRQHVDVLATRGQPAQSELPHATAMVRRPISTFTVAMR